MTLTAEVIAAIAPLVLQFMRGRQEAGEVQDAVAFREWLERDVFPQLLAGSDQIVATVVSMKAHQEERFSALQALLEEVRDAVLGGSASARWAELREVDRILLGRLLEAVEIDPDARLDRDSLLGGSGASEPDLRSSARFLHESELLRFVPTFGGWHVSPTYSGVVLAWEAKEPSAYFGAIGAIKRELPSSSSTARIGQIAERAGVSVGLTYFLLAHWKESGLLQLDEGIYPVARALVLNVSETLMRSSSGVSAPVRG